MASINASTTHVMKKKVSSKVGGPKLQVSAAKKPAGAPARRGSVAPPLKPATLATPQAMQEFLLKYTTPDERKEQVIDIFRQVVGEPSVFKSISTPHAASTTRDRAGAAGDLATLAKELGFSFVLKQCGILAEMQRILIPQGIQALLTYEDEDDEADRNKINGLRPSRSALSLTSLDEALSATANGSVMSDSKRGKTTPPNAREGCLLLLRGLCDAGKMAEPYVVGALLAAALDECGSSSSAVREAAEDAATAIVGVANPWAFPEIVRPLLLKSLASSEWRVKASALERLEQCAATAPLQIQKLIPQLLPPITNQVWDTKPQVSKAARSALLAVCQTNANADIKTAIPAVVNAICKPADTNKAVSELMGTTFVVPVDASTLAILCPVLARALKEKLAIHKRAACIVISNMSKLVNAPEAIAPFGSSLVPELKKVSENVQFEEIRDEALKALANLTKALGDSYSLAEDTGHADEMQMEMSAVEVEQERIRQERETEKQLEEEIKKKEEDERRRFKEAMDAQRELDRLAALAAAQKRKEEELKREKQKLSTKEASGKCQSCGLKKCKKSCMFYSGK